MLILQFAESANQGIFEFLLYQHFVYNTLYFMGVFMSLFGAIRCFGFLHFIGVQVFTVEAMDDKIRYAVGLVNGVFYRASMVLIFS